MNKLNYKEKRKICIISTNRADYGHLKNLVNKIRFNKKLQLQFVVTGSHLIKKYGYTINEILKDRIPIKNKIKVDIFEKDQTNRILKLNSKALLKFDKCFSN